MELTKEYFDDKLGQLDKKFDDKLKTLKFNQTLEKL